MLYRWGRISQQVPAPVGIERQMKESAGQPPASAKACVVEQSGRGCLLKDELIYCEKHLRRSVSSLTLKSRNLVNPVRVSLPLPPLSGTRSQRWARTYPLFLVGGVVENRCTLLSHQSSSTVQMRQNLVSEKWC